MREREPPPLWVTKMADDDRPEAKLPQASEKDFLTEKCSGRPSVGSF